MSRLVSVTALFWLAACSGPATDDPDDAQGYDASILVAIGPDDEIWFRDNLPIELRGELPIDDDSHSPVLATLRINPESIPGDELPVVFPADSTLPVYCGGHMESGKLLGSKCMVATPTAPTWVKVDGDIVLGEGQDLDTGRVICIAFVGDRSTANAACRRFDYL
jgi:hypothetical protein